MKVYLSTLGCKLNESELEAWARKFGDDGYQIVDEAKDADLVVLNTCTVTHVAARKSRQMARQLARINPNARLVLTGCYASVSPNEAQALPNVALVVPNVDKDRLVALAKDEGGRMLAKDEGGRRKDEENSFHPSSFILHPSSLHPSLRTRAFVKIQDGCNMSCTYCIIPLARGKEHSRPLADVVSEVKSLVNAGYKEIILTGVQISAYRDSVTPALAGGARVASPEGAKQSRSSVEIASSPNASRLLAMTNALRDLVSAILAETNVPRLRLTSIAPWDVLNGVEADESLLELFTDPRLCRHLHLSLQSGSDTVLRRMRRPYTTAQFARAVDSARTHIADVGITTDVIVGFPGESTTEFEQSLSFVERMQFSRVHVFPYSVRSGTVAASLPLHIDDQTKQARMKQMQSIAEASQRAFARQFIGREMMVLWESQEKDESRRMKDESPNQPPDFHPSSLILHPLVWSGYTDNYIRVVAPSDADLRNQITPARLISAFDDGAIGEVIQKYPK